MRIGKRLIFTVIPLVALVAFGCISLPQPEAPDGLPSAPEPAVSQQQQTTDPLEQPETGLQDLPGQKQPGSGSSQSATPPSQYDQQIKVKYQPKPDTIKVMTDALATGKPILIDFWAAWCGPCQSQKPIIKELEAAYSDQVIFLEIDVDDSEGSKLADEFKVEYIPDIVIINAKQEIAAHYNGFVDKRTLEQSIKSAVKK